MNCPYCGAELQYNDSYGSGRPENFCGTAGNGIYYPSTWEKLGDIYICPNREGFEDLDEAEEYKNESGIDCTAEEIVCDSATFNGFFYINENSSELKEGYPC